MGISWVEAKDAAKHPRIHEQPSTTKNYPAQTISIAIVEKRGPAFMAPTFEFLCKLLQIIFFKL